MYLAYKPLFTKNKVTKKFHSCKCFVQNIFTRKFVIFVSEIENNRISKDMQFCVSLETDRPNSGWGLVLN